MKGPWIFYRRRPPSWGDSRGEGSRGGSPRVSSVGARVYGARLWLETPDGRALVFAPNP